jgi:predicted transcriptional regulator
MHSGTHKRHRSELGILMDMLHIIADGGRDGVIVTDISRKSNAAHDMVIEKCKILLRSGIVESEVNGRNRIYRITQEGIKFFADVRNLQELVQSRLHIRI